MVHTGGGRRRGKSRILYWFRTPPGVRIGRSALDEAAIRLIEEHNPDVEFDWTRILKGQDAPPEQKVPQQDRRGRPRPRDYAPRQEAARPNPSVDSRAVVDPVSAEAAEEQTSEKSRDESLGGMADPRDSGIPAPTVAEPDTRLRAEEGAPRIDEAAIDELLSDSPLVLPGTEPRPDEPASPAQARLGSEGLSRLRARHAEVLARISETVTDPVRREELKSQAERLNPDTWVTDAEVTQGLESYETVFESLRTVVGRGRKRRRRSGGRSKDQPASGSPSHQDSASSDTAGGEEEDAQDTAEDL